MSQVLDLTLIHAGAVHGCREDKYLIKAVDIEDPFKFDILEAIPAKDGVEAINRALDDASRQTGIPVANSAKLPVRAAPAPAPAAA